MAGNESSKAELTRDISVPTPQLVLLPADRVDGEGVRVLVAGGDDGPGQGQHAAGLQGP